MAKVEITNLPELHEWDQVLLNYSVEGLNRILASEEFKQELLVAKLTETTPEFENIPLTNEQIYERIQKGDQLNPLDKLDVLDVEVVLYRKSWSKVVGYTFTNSLTIWGNRKFWHSPKLVTSNLFHETLHQLGFLHQGRWASSVPYWGNYVVEKLWSKLCQDLEKAYWEWWYS